ncbi:MAG TPA: flagellar biosynthetic protein FliR [Anaeromyxobacteraceae bacterium]
MEVPLHLAWGFSLVLFRTLGLFLTAPILASRTVPARVRLGIGVAVSLAVWSGAGGPAADVPASIWPLAASAAGETAVGALAGVAARMVLDAALAAGHLVSLSAGIGFGALLDPLSGAESSSTAELLSVGAQLAALALGLHREAIAWLARSCVAFPPGSGQGLRELALRAIWHGTGAASLAVRVAFPALAAVMVGHLVLGVLGRVAPQLGLANLGFTISVLAGGGALYLVAPGAAEVVARAALAAFA